MNNEFFQAITLAYLLYVAMPLCVGFCTVFVCNKLDERKHIEALIAEEDAELARLKTELDVK
ncbi:hypothetical protein QEU97_06770 [Trueperella pyogenes]|uniref:hypothetical protein n=1 Tax=Trueperella pyogenes TaxID=1661 RepID=UPI003132B89E